MSFPAVIELSALDGTNGFRISGAAYDQSGSSVASAGDVNGDGFDDLIIGAQVAGFGYGAAYVVFGGNAGFGANLDLSTLDGTNGFRLSGAAWQDRVGRSVASAGDVNGDGVGDLIVGAYGADLNGASSGAAYVVFGSATGFAANLDLSALDGTDGFRMVGQAANDQFGWSVASAGDINGDGLADLIVGARRVDANGSDSGAAYVVFGSAAGFGASLDLSALDGTNGFRINGVATFYLTGQSVAPAGDVNGDGLDDLIVGADRADTNGYASGGSYVVFGSAAGFGASLELSTLDGTNGFRISGVTVRNYSGGSVASAGDVNGDGVDDLIIGAWGADPNGSDAGAAYVVFGGDAGFGPNIDLSTLDGTNGFRISGVTDLDRSGWSVASAGDINGDGFADLIVGAPRSDINGLDSGASYVVFGAAAGFAANIDLSTLDGSTGFRINGGAADDRSGWSVAAAGDVNGDGLDDLIVGAYRADPNGDFSGASYVIFGVQADLTLTGSAAGETLTGRSADDTLHGLDGADLLYGLDGDDALEGGAGADLLDGGTGADAMAGGAGDDTYIVDDIADLITEAGAEGSDRVRTSVSYVLSDNLENLTLEGTGDIDGTGNGLNNVLDGNSGANTLNGGDGADLVKGGAGDDVLNGGTGADQLLGGIGEDELDGADDNDRLEGGDGDDVLLGGAGADILDGGADNDSLSGGTGADQLFGGAGSDTLDGGEGNDSLNGGAGADAMVGGLGDDIFFVDDAGDTTDEASGQGTDQVRAGISVTLAANIEILVLQGGADLDGTGNALANTLNGNAGANVLDGLGGNDILKGGDGSDSLIGGTGNDVLAGGAGGDRFVVRQESVFSGPTPEVDTISDFLTSQGDVIDLSAIDAIAGGADDAFTLVGAFTGQAGQMTLSFAGGITTLRLDTDGDGLADYLMKINGDVRGDSGGWSL